MKNALISPNESVQALTSWNEVNGKWYPVFTDIPNGARIAEVADVPFEVAQPLFWVECADDVNGTEFYYDLVQQAIFKIPEPVPQPVQ